MQFIALLAAIVVIAALGWGLVRVGGRNRPSDEHRDDDFLDD